MSSLLVLQDKDNIIMASDTASSVRIDNISYRVSDSEEKIFDINDYKVFASGQLHIRDLFIHMSRSEGSSFTPSIAEKILKKFFLKFDEYCLEIVIAKKLSDSTVLYTLSSYNEFSIETNVSTTKEISAFAAGIQTKDILNTFEDEFLKTNKLYESIIKSYNLNQTEEVGGSVEIHQAGIVSPTVVQRLNTKNIRRIQRSSSEHLIVGDRIIGKLILGTQLMAEDENGIIRIRGSIQEVFDKQGNVKVALGEYAPGLYGLKVHQGAIEIIGGLTENQLSQSVKNKLGEADGIRNDLRLTAPLPTNLSLNGEGITATVTGNPSKFVRMDYRGLYVQNGAIDIRTGATTNRGVIFDGMGLRAYNTAGTKTFDIDTNGNAIFSGRLEAASGTFSGALSAATGTFSGRLSAASGSFSGDITGSNGTFSGNLSAVGGTFSGSLSGANGTFSGTLSGGTIQGGTINGTNITGTSITGGTISGTTITGVTMNSGTINISEDIRVGNNIYLGANNYISEKNIIFSGSASMTYRNDSLTLSTLGTIELYAGTRVGIRGTLDLSTASSVNWGTHKPVAVWG